MKNNKKIKLIKKVRDNKNKVMSFKSLMIKMKADHNKKINLMSIKNLITIQIFNQIKR